MFSLVLNVRDSCKHIFCSKMVDNNLAQNVTYPAAGSKMIQKCLKIWDKMSHAITASPCSCCLNFAFTTLQWLWLFSFSVNISLLHIWIAWIMIKAYCVFVWLWAVVCSVFWPHSVGPWENAQTLSCCLPYPPSPIPIPAMDSSAAIWCLLCTCFAMFLQCTATWCPSNTLFAGAFFQIWFNFTLYWLPCVICTLLPLCVCRLFFLGTI